MAEEGGGNAASTPLTPDAEAEAAWRRAAAAERSAYDNFLVRLRHPSAKPLVHRMQTFVADFAGGRSAAEASEEIHRFQDRAVDWMLSKAVVFAAEADEEGSREAKEGLEKFLLCRLYAKVFAAYPEDQEADISLSKHIGGLSWIELKHMGIPPVQLALFPVAIQELRSIDEYRAPRDKLLCILNACNVVNDILKATHEGIGDGKVRALSADDFLPLLIYLVIQANPARLHSNAEFVAAFRHPSRLSGEDAYFATAFCSAKEFLRNSGPSEFEVTLEEYTMRYANAVSKAEQAEGATAATGGCNEAPEAGGSELSPTQAASQASLASRTEEAGSPRTPPAGRADSAEGSDDDSDERERLIFSVREAHVYQIPPATSAAGHKADHWQKAICKGPLRIAGKGNHLSILIFDGSSGSLFAQCEMPAGEHNKFVEPVTDSSRYFVLRITNGQRHAFIGVGFDDRNDSFDFKCALTDYKSREAASARRPTGSQVPTRDLSLKDGEKIAIKLRGVASKRDPERPVETAAEGTFLIPALPQPVGGSATRPCATSAHAPASTAAGPSGATAAVDPSHGDGASAAVADLFDDFVSAAPSQSCATWSGGTPCASSPADSSRGRGAWDDLGGSQACAGPREQTPQQPSLEPGQEVRAQPQLPTPQGSSGQARPEPRQQPAPDGLAAVDLLHRESTATPPPSPRPEPRLEGLGEPQGEAEDPFAEFCSIGMDHFNKAVPCR